MKRDCQMDEKTDRDKLRCQTFNEKSWYLVAPTTRSRKLWGQDLCTQRHDLFILIPHLTHDLQRVATCRFQARHGSSNTIPNTERAHLEKGKVLARTAWSANKNLVCCATFPRCSFQKPAEIPPPTTKQNNECEASVFIVDRSINWIIPMKYSSKQHVH